jgi:putative iron-regulated protein
MNLHCKFFILVVALLPLAACEKKQEVTGAAVVEHYATMAHAVFGDALTEAQKLQQAVDELVKEPTDANLQAAKNAWLAARIPYMQSEVFRFGNPVVDDWEGQLNAWPLDEGLIDYVAGNYQYALGNPGATANIVASTSLKVGAENLDLSNITPELLASLNEIGGSEANVATGYHAIEFLLWGQDLNGTGDGAGNRPVSDYAQGADCTHGNCARRAQYLQAATQLLVKDLQDMVAQWEPLHDSKQQDNYRATLVKETPEQGLRKMLFGMGSLSLGELAGERMKVALEANSTEDEHDCFSDNTHNSHFYDAKGVRNIYLGEYKRVDGSVLKGPSLSDLVKAKDEVADRELQANLATTEIVIQAMVDSANAGQHFDQLIASGNDAGNTLVKNSIAALVMQTASIETAAKLIGIMDLNPDTADHAF